MRETGVNSNQKGFGVVGVIVIILVIAAVGGVGYSVYNSQNNKNTTTSNDSNQTNQKQYLEIKEWGVKLQVGSASSDRFSYSLGEMSSVADEQYVVLLDRDISKVEPNGPCEAETVITRSKDGLFSAPDGSTRTSYSKTKQIGDYYYRVVPPQGCGYTDEALIEKINLASNGGFDLGTDLANLTSN